MRLNSKNKVVIKSDPLNIVNRLKRINKNYFLVYNKTTKFYEVHNSKNLQNTFEFSTSCTNIDCRIINQIFKKISLNKTDIIKLIEKNNEKIEKNKEINLSDEMNIKFKDIHKYASQGAKEFTDTNAFENIWI